VTTGARDGHEVLAPARQYRPQVLLVDTLAARGEPIVPTRLMPRLLARWRVPPPAAGDHPAPWPSRSGTVLRKRTPAGFSLPPLRGRAISLDSTDQ
jgi:hypothetical protein